MKHLENYIQLLNKRKSVWIKVRDMQKHPQPTEVELNKKNWINYVKFGLKLVRRSMIVLIIVKKIKLHVLAKATFTDEKNYVKQPIQNNRQKVHVESEATINEQKEDYETLQYETMNYGKFLEQISRATSLQPSMINKYVIEGMKLKNNEKVYINENTMNNLIKSFNKRFNNFFADLYHYEPLDFNASTSCLRL